MPVIFILSLGWSLLFASWIWLDTRGLARYLHCILTCFIMLSRYSLFDSNCIQHFWFSLIWLIYPFPRIWIEEKTGGLQRRFWCEFLSRWFDRWLLRRDIWSDWGNWRCFILFTEYCLFNLCLLVCFSLFFLFLKYFSMLYKLRAWIGWISWGTILVVWSNCYTHPLRSILFDELIFILFSICLWSFLKILIWLAW